MRHRSCVVALLLVLLFANSPAGAADARANYKKHCTSCHGPDGKAQTRLGRKSGAKDLSDKPAIAKLSDDEIFKTIKEGRKNAKGEEKMEPFGGEMSDAEMKELVAFVRRELAK